MRHAELSVSRSAVRSSIGMICTGHRLSADAGAQVLADGGNAIDAAAAAVFTSWVVEPEMCGIGGTVQGVMHLASGGETSVLFPVRGVPAAATEDMFQLESGLDPWGTVAQGQG